MLGMIKIYSNIEIYSNTKNFIRIRIKFIYSIEINRSIRINKVFAHVYKQIMLILKVITVITYRCFLKFKPSVKRTSN